MPPSPCAVEMLCWEAPLATDALTPLPEATLFFFWLLAGLGFYQPLPGGKCLPDACVLENQQPNSGSQH